MSEFNWTDHAFGVLSDCDLWDQADHLQAEFDHVVGMTDHSFGGKDVDTSAFRCAILPTGALQHVIAMPTHVWCDCVAAADCSRFMLYKFTYIAALMHSDMLLRKDA